MGNRPAFVYSLPARRAGSFGTSGIGRLAEALTTTWFRFETFLVWILVAVSLIVAPPPSFALTSFAVIFSPITAVFFVVVFKALSWVAYFIPKIGAVAGWLRYIFYAAFSRFVVQPAPEIELPFWGHK